MSTLMITSIVVLWLSIGVIVQTRHKVIWGLAFGYQYSSSLRDYAELLVVLILVCLLWPVGGNNTIEAIERVGKFLHFQHYD